MPYSKFTLSTVARLQTNRQGVVNMRRILAVMVEHPPD
jgi:hypothetical protein